MRERERKFLLKPEDFPEDLLAKGRNIEQGYLMLHNDGRQLRVRIYNNTIAFLCYKIQVSESEKEEFEHPISISEARKLMDSTDIKLLKIRYSTKYKDNTVHIDTYPSGLGIVEIEYKDILKAEDIPSYCGAEVTGVADYSNIQIALANSKQIPEDAGYHTVKIKKGILGWISKIQEELDELADAENQNSRVMISVELADLYGAIEAYAERQDLKMEDLKIFNEITKRAFKNGTRT